MSKNSGIVIPYGWQRCIEPQNSGTSVTYISPSGAVLSSIAEICQYLERDNTCKCGVQCPLYVPKVFNFNPEVHSVNLSGKDWSRHENKTESHRKNCQHWNKLQKTQIGKKKAASHSELTLEPPPKLIIIRKGGQLTSVIPDKRNTGSKKENEAANKQVKVPSSSGSIGKPGAAILARKRSIVSPVKSPLFEAAQSAVTESENITVKSKSDFKLQWIKADDELSHNDTESGNELCFSPDFKRSPPIPFPHSLISDLDSPTPVLFKQGGHPANVNPPRGLFMQITSTTGSLPSMQTGIEPVHRFGMSAFPGTNFVTKHEPGMTGNTHAYPREVQRYPIATPKDEQCSQWNRSSPFPLSSPVRSAQPRGFIRPGMAAPESGGMGWYQNQANFVSNTQKQMCINPPGNFSAISSQILGPRGNIPSMKSPTRQSAPQRFPVGSPPPLNPTSPYSYHMGGPGQSGPLGSPGHRTNPSPFSNRSQSRSSSVGTPAASPGGHWQGSRPVHMPDGSRPLSRSSNAATPDASQSLMTQWNSGNVNNAGGFASRAPGAIRTFTPNMSPGPTSPFSSSRFPQNSSLQRFPQDKQGPQADMTHPGYPLHQLASQQPKYGNQALRQQSKASGDLASMQYQPPPSPFAPNMGIQSGQQRFARTVEGGPTTFNPSIFRPCPPYRPARIQFARINEPDPNTRPRFPFSPCDSHIGGPRMQPRAPMYQQRFSMERQWRPFSPKMPSLMTHQHHTSTAVAPSGIRNAPSRMPRAQNPKPKRTRRRKTTKAAVTKSEQPQILNTNFTSSEFPDFFEPCRTTQGNASNKFQQSSSADNINATRDVNSQSVENVLQPNESKVLSSMGDLESNICGLAPTLIMPDGMQTPPSTSTLIQKPLHSGSSPLKPDCEIAAAVTTVETLVPCATTPFTQSNANLKDSTRGVTTPPLPVLSPTSLFEDATDGGEDDFSDFASPGPAVFDFPISTLSMNEVPPLAKSSITSTNTSTTILTGTSFSSNDRNPSLISKTMAVNAPIMSAAVNQVNAAAATSMVKAEPTRVEVSDSSSGPASSSKTPVPVAHSVGHTDNTRLVSSSGKVFHVPKRFGTKTMLRRFSDQLYHRPTNLLPDVRRRFLSDPSPAAMSSFVRSSQAVKRSCSSLSFDLQPQAMGTETEVHRHSSNSYFVSSTSAVSFPCTTSFIPTIIEQDLVSRQKFNCSRDSVNKHNPGSEILNLTQGLALPTQQYAQHLDNENLSPPDDSCSKQTRERRTIRMGETASVETTVPGKICQGEGVSSPLQSQEKLDDLPSYKPAAACSPVTNIPCTSEVPKDPVKTSSAVRTEGTGSLNDIEGNIDQPTQVLANSNETLPVSRLTELVKEEEFSSSTRDISKTPSWIEISVSPAIKPVESPNIVILGPEGDSKAFKKPPHLLQTSGSSSSQSEVQHLSDLKGLGKQSCEVVESVIASKQKDVETSPHPSKNNPAEKTPEDTLAEASMQQLSATEHVKAKKESEISPDANSENVTEKIRSTATYDSTVLESTDDSSDSSKGNSDTNTIVHAAQCEEQTTTESQNVDSLDQVKDDNRKIKEVDQATENENADVLKQVYDIKSTSTQPPDVAEETSNEVSEKADVKETKDKNVPNLPPSKECEDVDLVTLLHVETTVTATSQSSISEKNPILHEAVMQYTKADENSKQTFLDTHSPISSLDRDNQLSGELKNRQQHTPDSLNKAKIIEGVTTLFDDNCPISTNEDMKDCVTITSTEDLNPGEEADDKLEGSDLSVKTDLLVTPSPSTSLQPLSTTSLSMPSAGISPDLTDTVIRQLSSYNTFLKNLLVSGVGPIDSATLDQLSSGVPKRDESQTKMLSALIANTVQMNRLHPSRLFKEADLLQSSSSGLNIPAAQNFKESPDNQKITLLSLSGTSTTEGSVQENVKANTVEETVHRMKAHVAGSDADTGLVESSEPSCSIADVGSRTPPSNAGPKNSSHQGLQVPIVSSSVKGSNAGDGDEEEQDGNRPMGLNNLKVKQIVQDEVSTSVKASESIELAVPLEHVVTAETSAACVPEKRRARTRNAASKQNMKRSSLADPSTERAQKRVSTNTSRSSSPNLRTAQRGTISAEKQHRTVKSGDLVWGQMRGFPSWPGKVVKPAEVRSLQQRAPLSDGKVWVKWFGDHTFTQMNPADLVTMTEGLEAHHRSRKKGRTRTRKISAHLETAIQEAVDELEQQQGTTKKPASLQQPSSSGSTSLLSTETPEKLRRGRKRKAT